MNLNVRLKYAKETKNKYRFEEVDEHGVLKGIQNSFIGVVYLPKELFNGKRPSHITVDVKLDG